MPADAGGVVETDETVEVPADTVIAAVGEKVPGHSMRVSALPWTAEDVPR